MFVLIVFVTLTAGQPAQIYSISGQFSWDTCRGLLYGKVQEAQRAFPGAAVAGQCVPMAKL